MGAMTRGAGGPGCGPSTQHWSWEGLETGCGGEEQAAAGHPVQAVGQTGAGRGRQKRADLHIHRAPAASFSKQHVSPNTPARAVAAGVPRAPYGSLWGVRAE